MRQREVEGKRVAVVGAARSGLAVAELLCTAGADVFVTDSKEIDEKDRARLEDIRVPYEQGGHSDRVFEVDMVVVSPGVPSTAPIVRGTFDRGLPVYSEIEAASWFCRGPIVAITGSNGKTTTTALAGHLFRSAGRRVHVGGNIGNAFSTFVMETRPDDVVVLEVSSFQLDHIDAFRPSVSVLLNITPDHLDRYDHDFEKYAHSKGRIFENQRSGDACVYNADDPVVRDQVKRFVESVEEPERPQLLGISLENRVEAGAFVKRDDLILRLNQQEEVLMQAEELSLRGRHNLYNSLAAAVAARVMEVRSDIVRESLMSFEGVPHRLEFIRELDGVRYVNDSKATNVNAVWYALESFTERVVLIAGGRDKGNDYSSLKPLIRDKARAVIAIGESASKIASELGPETQNTVEAEDMDEAVRFARIFAEPGDVVLLSPACASFDMFENYEDRGDTFKNLVNSL